MEVMGISPRRARALAIISAFAIALTSACGSSDDTTPAPSSQTVGAFDPDVSGTLTAVDAKTGFVLAPGGTATFAVVLKDAGGVPLAGKGVWFVAPVGGATGSFLRSEAAAPSYAFAVTDDKGVATATLTANATPGVYLVEAWISSDVTTTFGVTNVAAPAPTPALTAEAARQAIEPLAPSGRPAPAPRLHGPVLLEKGASIASEDERTPPIVIARTSWFFWIDDEPRAAFDHPARFVVLDAAAPGAQPVVTNTTSIPLVALAGGAPRPLFPARALEGPPPTPPSAIASVTQALENAGTTCATVLHGGPDKWWTEDGVHLEKSLRKAGVAHVYSTVDVSTLEDFKKHLDAIKADPACKCLLVYLGSHGMPGSIGIPAAPGAKAFTPYKDFAKEIELRFSGSGVKLKVILNGCYTASGVDAFDGIGMDGELFSAADADHASQHHEHQIPVETDPNDPNDEKYVKAGQKSHWKDQVDDFGHYMGDGIGTGASLDDAFTMARDRDKERIRDPGASCFTLHAKPNGRPPAKTFGVDPIVGVFNQAIFTTSYKAVIHNPTCEEVTFEWTGPNCSIFTPKGPQKSKASEIVASMNWQHASTSQGGGCPENHPNHDDATIKLEVTLNGKTAVCTFVGADTKTGEACAPK